ncbi:tRNA glutamyl-Q(34) synthetase GluQRS [Povalibacter sp.]|uniref:tRNA glutamyl-Q(34) synthetase GluQRS n=1 Tax=Povalibacter sp. TaxID=1962978 RepID=UPI002D1FA1D9|nr:tRNA glutamyl-Q(34) synthetase GluQRS [Povalibacter sp.]
MGTIVIAERSAYRGRFAPSPTGLLHFGSLVAAVASRLDARHAGGEWLIRMEDLDRPREVPGSADAILRALEILGFTWTESIVRQSERSDLYQAALDRLLSNDLAYPCSCSRSEIQQVASPDHPEGEELRYPGWCRTQLRHRDRPYAIRLRVPDGEIAFDDRIQGRIAVDVAAEIGDFVIRRRDGLFAYQLAVVVDDASQGITHVVRGADLLRSTPRQILLQRCLGLPTPEYAHVPVATDSSGIKLSKSAGAAAVDLNRPGEELWRALQFLRQDPPPELRRDHPAMLWDWATGHWRLEPLSFGHAVAPV